MSEDEKTIIDFLKKCKENKDKVIPLLQQSNETLLNYIDKLNNQLQQKENIIKEAKDFINGKDLKENEYRFTEDFNFAKLLEILDKGE